MLKITLSLKTYIVYSMTGRTVDISGYRKEGGHNILSIWGWGWGWWVILGDAMIPF